MNIGISMAKERSIPQLAYTPETEKLIRSADLMQSALLKSTGLSERERKLVVYWTLATHALPHLNMFPVLVLIGKMGTGKSQTLKIINNFAFRPVRMSLRGMTGPAIRDKLAACYEGTAIIEEADAAWKDADSNFESLISDRYHRDSAEAALKEKSRDKNWHIATRKYFGATVLHRRVTFIDAALDGRSIITRFKPDHNRHYHDFDPNEECSTQGRELIRDVAVELPEAERPDGVAARTFNTYKPLLCASKLCRDTEFENQTMSRLLHDTLELKEAQGSEPDGLVLRAIVESVFQSGIPQFGNIKFSSLSQIIWDNHRFTITPRQIGPIVRELGFETKASHGVTVVAPSVATLLKACEESEYIDDGIEGLRKHALDLLKESRSLLTS